jgi:hypothetical protein
MRRSVSSVRRCSRASSGQGLAALMLYLTGSEWGCHAAAGLSFISRTVVLVTAQGCSFVGSTVAGRECGGLAHAVQACGCLPWQLGFRHLNLQHAYLSRLMRLCLCHILW